MGNGNGNGNYQEIEEVVDENSICDILCIPNKRLTLSQTILLFKLYDQALQYINRFFQNHPHQRCNNIITSYFQDKILELRCVGFYQGVIYVFKFLENTKFWILFEYRNKFFRNSLTYLKQWMNSDYYRLSHRLKITTITEDFESPFIWVTNVLIETRD